ncbi:3-deoxy-8-phosphooctulonate synthase [Marinigracilibium pacificum]|uniref:3-deoxy-8-phosphooctulonate synthase n=1 Tax=Marinigracilibium pacificum TaxID=2729599 RepID=A0A848IXP2_9BACT|nr:3-deoxy-8-phosphooctulonate synthase [Marinigracilibium pacificum]NMM48055.1 3-deoxy-8-phosphooctulonate synthase [Marinigracilibium pacificum]
MERYKEPVKITDKVILGGETPVLLAGPCAVENWDVCATVAEQMKAVAEKEGFGYVFKASYDKANRTSADSFRSIGVDEALKVLQRVKDEFDLPIVTDVHETHEITSVAEVADVLQIPAFLCRQTSLLVEAGKSGCAVNIKKGQFMDPQGMQYAAEKVNAINANKAFLTERGTTFGYNNLVVDIRSLPIMRQYAPVVFDVTHSVQQPGGLGGKSGGQRQFAPFLAKAAAAAGVDGFFIETHPEPSKALSDGPNMVPLAEMAKFLNQLKTIWSLSNE